jgi:hypothetical protein
VLSCCWEEEQEPSYGGSVVVMVCRSSERGSITIEFIHHTEDFPLKYLHKDDYSEPQTNVQLLLCNREEKKQVCMRLEFSLISRTQKSSCT